MTNGEKIKALFPDMYQVEQSSGDWDSWWNTEYKEPTTKNSIAIDKEQLKTLIRGLTKWYVKRDNTEVGEPNTAVGLLYDDVMFGIDRLSSVIPQPRWISVSERLPEDRRLVLVTAYWHETYQVMMASYFGDGLWWCVPFNNCGEHMQRLKPKAWMPLPKPYNAQKSEG